MMTNETETKKQTNLMLTPACHLKLKVIAAMSGKSMGEVIWILLNRLEPGKSVDDDLQTLEVLEKIQKDDAENNELAEAALQAEGV